MSIPTGAVAVLRLQRILIRQQKRLYTLSHSHSPCSLRFLPQCMWKKKTPNKTKHIFYFLLINTTVSHCKNPDNPGNPVITEKKRALCLTMTINKRWKKISSFTFLIFFNDVSQCHLPPPPPHASFEGLHSLPKSIIGDHNRVFLLPLIRRSAIWAGEKKMAEKRRHV